LANKGTRHCGRASSHPAVSATDGTRHCGQALLVPAMQKSINQTAAQPCQQWPQQEDFFAGKVTAHASTLMQRLTQSAAFFKQKCITREVKFACFHGAPLKRREEQVE
jgi:hypothetical protein